MAGGRGTAALLLGLAPKGKGGEEAPDDMEEMEESGDGLRIAAADLMRGIKEGDRGLVQSALRAAVAACAHEEE